jgi:hypothetical protein
MTAWLVWTTRVARLLCLVPLLVPLLVLAAVWTRLMTIPELPLFQPPSSLMIDWGNLEIDKGTYNAAQDLYWDWYKFGQTIAIGYTKVGVLDCAVYVEWANGEATCVKGPRWIEHLPSK